MLITPTRLFASPTDVCTGEGRGVVGPGSHDLSQLTRGLGGLPLCPRALLALGLLSAELKAACAAR